MDKDLLKDSLCSFVDAPDLALSQVRRMDVFGARKGWVGDPRRYAEIRTLPIRSEENHEEGLTKCLKQGIVGEDTIKQILEGRAFGHALTERPK